VGRARFYRQRIRTEAASVEAKTLFDYLASEIRRSREVCADEAALIAKDAMKYLNGHLGMRELGQIEFPAVVAEGGHFRRARRDQDERMVRLTVIEDDDASVLSEFGMSLMVTGRMARVIEEAHYQGYMLDANRLCVLFPLNVTAIRARLGALIDQGAMLPLAGMSRSTREKFEAPRPVLAVKRYLQGEKVQDIRRSLVVSRGKWREWWVSFRKAVELGERSVEDIAEVVSQARGGCEGLAQSVRAPLGGQGGSEGLGGRGFVAMGGGGVLQDEGGVLGASKEQARVLPCGGR
jgi:Protein of unknown function (DUF1670).